MTATFHYFFQNEGLPVRQGDNVAGVRVLSALVRVVFLNWVDVQRSIRVGFEYALLKFNYIWLHVETDFMFRCWHLCKYKAVTAIVHEVKLLTLHSCVHGLQKVMCIHPNANIAYRVYFCIFSEWVQCIDMVKDDYQLPKEFGYEMHHHHIMLIRWLGYPYTYFPWVVTVSEIIPRSVASWQGKKSVKIGIL